MEEQAPDFIRNLGSGSNHITSNGIVSSAEQAPDFIKSLNSRKDIVEEDSMTRLKNNEVSQQLGIDLDTEWSQDEKAVSDYVDALSDEDYDTRLDLKNQGYSLEARKALFDNREDLYDIKEPGNNKFWSGKGSLMQRVLNQIQGAVDFQEDVVHPWSMTAQDWLDVQAADLMDYKFEDIYQEKYQDMLNTDNKLLQTVKRAAMLPDSLIKRGASVAGGILFDLAGKAVNLFDNLRNITTQVEGLAANAIAGDKKGYNLVITEPSKEPNILGSYIEAVGDALGGGFTISFPIATWILSTLGTESDWTAGKMEAINNGITGVYKRIDQKTGLNKYLAANLTEEEKEQYYDNMAMATFIVFSALMGEGIRTMSKTEIYQRFQKARQLAKETSKIGLNEGIREVQETKNIMEQQPEGTEFRTEGGTKIGEVTSNGVKTTPYGSLKVLQKLIGRQFNGWRRGFERAREMLKNKDKLVTRDPNSPVGELPVVDITDVKNTDVPEKPTEEIKPTDEIKEGPVEEKPVEEVKTPVEEVKITKPVAKKVDSNGNQSLLEYIKEISNSISGKKGGMDKELFEKFSNSQDLQHEYITTIDPYLRSNGGANPSGVIEDQLIDFVDTVKEQLQDRRNNNIDFRKGQMKYKVQIPESDKVKRDMEDREIKDLIKTLSKQSADSEKFLNYLLKLPEDKIQAFNKYIPDFSRNLGLIKDTLDLTKAISSKDLLGKFLNFKSTRGTRDRKFIRKYIYKKLNEAYRKAGIKRNMYEIEKMLNKLTEQQLIELEKSIEGAKDLPSFVKQDFLDQITWNLEREVREGKNDKVILPRGKDTVRDKLIKQGYQNPKTREPFKTKEEVENYKLPNGKTVKEFLNDMNYKLEHLPYSLKLGQKGTADLVERTINYYGDIDKLPEYVVQHEIGHAFLGALTTAEYLDLVEGFSKATKSLKKYNPNLNISEYKSLAKSEVGATEFIPDSIGLFLTHMDINGMGDYLQPYLTPALGSKVKKILNDIGKDLRDEFSSVEVNGKKFTPSEEVEKLTDRGLNDKEFQNRTHNDLDSRINGKQGYNNRLKDRQKIDPNVKRFDWDLDVNSKDFGRMKVYLENGEKLTWEEYKNTLSPELKEKLYEDREIQDIEKELSDYRKNKIGGEKELPKSQNEGVSESSEELIELQKKEEYWKQESYKNEMKNRDELDELEKEFVEDDYDYLEDKEYDLTRSKEEIEAAIDYYQWKDTIAKMRNKMDEDDLQYVYEILEEKKEKRDKLKNNL